MQENKDTKTLPSGECTGESPTTEGIMGGTPNATGEDPAPAEGKAFP